MPSARTRRGRARRASGTTSSDRFPVSDAERQPSAVQSRGVRSSPRTGRRRDGPGRGRSCRPTKSSAFWPRRRCATRRPAIRSTGAAADIAILFRSRDSHREFEAALERRARPDLRLQGAGFLRGRRNAGRRGAACAFWRIRRRICAPPPSCARGSSGCRTWPIRRAGARDLRRRLSMDADGSGDGRPCLPKIAGCSDRVRAAVARWLDLGRSHAAAELLDARARGDGLRLRDSRSRARAGA